MSILQCALYGVDALVQLVEQRALVVGLDGFNLHTQPFLDLRQCGRAANVRLTAAEQVQVGAMEDEDKANDRKPSQLQVPAGLCGGG